MVSALAQGLDAGPHHPLHAAAVGKAAAQVARVVARAPGGALHLLQRGLRFEHVGVVRILRTVASTSSRMLICSRVLGLTIMPSRPKQQAWKRL
ncbi:hypothetical protein [Thauera sp. SDU_THAU2]|uniref:hypothetical protein n=1 Tax=Thauera sp. SDU_THAU2 TaxID=3136633 RepID=UPI00311F4404